jgi:hypothetical protein
VVEYAALGDHRTGTTVDEAMCQWFAAQLVDIGARVETIPYSFERYDARARLRFADGTARDALPLFYSGIGRAEVADPPRVELPTTAGFPLGDVDALVAAAPAGEAVVVVSAGPGGRLVAPNRAPVMRPRRLAVLVDAAASAAIAAGPAHLSVAATLVPGASVTVVGALGPDAPEPVVVTTPLSGWFACAGERGTGIAVALDVAARLAARHPVLVVGTTGHELEFLGAREFLAARPVRPRAVLQLGAGLAAGDPDAGGTVRLGAVRVAMTTVADPAPLLAALAPAGFAGVLDPPWPGEGELWRESGAPVLALLAGFERFHTPDDVPAAVTSPELLECVSEAVAVAADILAG